MHLLVLITVQLMLWTRVGRECCLLVRLLLHVNVLLLLLLLLL
jgi:hypothetical protein